MIQSVIQARINEEIAAGITTRLVDLYQKNTQARLDLADWQLGEMTQPIRPGVVNPTLVELTAKRFASAGCHQTACLIRRAFGSAA